MGNQHLSPEISTGTPPAPESSRPPGSKMSPGIVAGGSAVFAAGAGLNLFWVVAAAVLGYFVGKQARKEQTREEEID